MEARQQIGLLLFRAAGRTGQQSKTIRIADRFEMTGIEAVDTKTGAFHQGRQRGATELVQVLGIAVPVEVGMSGGAWYLDDDPATVGTKTVPVAEFCRNVVNVLEYVEGEDAVERGPSQSSAVWPHMIEVFAR